MNPAAYPSGVLLLLGRIMDSIPWEYDGEIYRSKLEATYAAFFERCGWIYCYEPFAVQGWGPDFCLYDYPSLVEETGQRFKPTVLVEVKPDIHKYKGVCKAREAWLHGLTANRTLGEYRTCPYMVVVPDLIAHETGGRIGIGYREQFGELVAVSWDIKLGKDYIALLNSEPSIAGRHCEWFEEFATESPEVHVKRAAWEWAWQTINDNGSESIMPARKFGVPDTKDIERRLRKKENASPIGEVMRSLARGVVWFP